MFPSTCAHPPCMKIDVKSVRSTGTWWTRTTGRRPVLNADVDRVVAGGHRMVSSHGTKPYSAVTAVKPSIRTGPRFDWSTWVGAFCDQMKTARLTAIRAIVRTGRRRVGTLS